MIIDYRNQGVWVKLTQAGENCFQNYLEELFPRTYARKVAEMGYRVPDQELWIKLDLQTLGEMFTDKCGSYTPFEDGEIHLTCPFVEEAKNKNGSISALV